MNRLSIFVLAMFSTFALATVGCSKKRAKTTPTAKATVAEDTSGPVEETKEPEVSADETPAPVEETTPASQLTNVIYFAFDSFQLDQAAREALNNNAEWLKEDANRVLTVEGHTDQTGTTEYNLGLGERRARAALEYLVKLGIEKSRIKVITFGEERPADDGNDAKNRRSMFIASR